MGECLETSQEIYVLAAAQIRFADNQVAPRGLRYCSI